MDSLWAKTAAMPEFEPLKGDRKLDVLIIGGGITGLLCAHMLEKSGVNYALIEADRICSGITKNTTAKITLQHGLIYHKLTDKYGPEMAQMYLEANKAALDTYRELCAGIDCGFEEKDSYVFSTHDCAVLEQEQAALDRLGYGTHYVEALPISYSVAGALMIKRQAQFHPLKFLSAIAGDLNIYEHTKALEWRPHLLRTNHGTIRAQQIIVTTHFPFLNNHGSYFLKLYQHRSYVLALENAEDMHGMYVDESPDGLSFRNSGELLLLGGGSHRTGKQGGSWTELENFARCHYPRAKEVARWAAQDCMSLDGVPYIGQYSKHTPGLYVATGFNKWGMTTSMAAAKILTEEILGCPLPYAPVFSPSRSILHPQLAINAGHTVFNLVTPTVPRCPHLGCALKYNPQEHSWDCPCHGSRFTDEGRLIDNPAAAGLKSPPPKR